MTEGDHHHNDREIRGFSNECRIEVERLYDLGITVPTNILAHLIKNQFGRRKKQVKKFFSSSKNEKIRQMHNQPC